MAVLAFKYGQNLTDSIPFVSGTIYLDINTGEFWFDDPSSTEKKHQKVIDTDTLVYEIDKTVEWGGSAGNATAKLGLAVLGTMVLGTE